MRKCLYTVCVHINPQEVRYSHLILCTGTSGDFPGKHNSVDSYQSAIQKYEDFVKLVSFLSGHVYICDIILNGLTD